MECSFLFRQSIHLDWVEVSKKLSENQGNRIRKLGGQRECHSERSGARNERGCPLGRTVEESCCEMAPKDSSTNDAGLSRAVHPRTCGEHRSVRRVSEGRFGSSPHLRGTHGRSDPMIKRFRFIPAPAGNTLDLLGQCRLRTVHPRTCGEHWGFSSVDLGLNGSSPHLRGTLNSGRPIAGQRRFIPAPAGNTTTAHFRRQNPTVHPRTCGEHADRIYKSSFRSGSSPHLRGTLLGLTNVQARLRFIPAPAGNTAHLRPRRRRPAVHPRTCGEHVGSPPTGTGFNGSSPHLRGTLSPRDKHDLICRFIPAPAGNTGACAAPTASTRFIPAPAGNTAA